MSIPGPQWPSCYFYLTCAIGSRWAIVIIIGCLSSVRPPVVHQQFPLNNIWTSPNFTGMILGSLSKFFKVNKSGCYCNQRKHFKNPSQKLLVRFQIGPLVTRLLKLFKLFLVVKKHGHQGPWPVLPMLLKAQMHFRDVHHATSQWTYDRLSARCQLIAGGYCPSKLNQLPKPQNPLPIKEKYN